MKSCLGVIFLLLLSIAPSVSRAETPSKFWKIWGDGRGEISSYHTVTTRYGVERPGKSVLIFVTEDFNPQAQVKIDHPEKVSDRLPVLKLNATRQFVTGIYEYSMMLSVFSALAPWHDRRGHHHPMHRPVKLSFSVSEWCGNYYEQWNAEGATFRRTAHSYFEKEGDTRDTVDAPLDVLLQDELPLRVRELVEPLVAGEMEILPSIVYSRLNSTLFPNGKQQSLGLSISAGSFRRNSEEVKTKRFVFRTDSWTQTFEVETEGEKRLIAWRTAGEGFVDRGELIESERLAYWDHKSNEDVRMRERFGLSIGVK